jgi:hypothetical protein
VRGGGGVDKERNTFRGWRGSKLRRNSHTPCQVVRACEYVTADSILTDGWCVIELKFNYSHTFSHQYHPLNCDMSASCVQTESHNFLTQPGKSPFVFCNGSTYSFEINLATHLAYCNLFTHSFCCKFLRIIFLFSVEVAPNTLAQKKCINVLTVKKPINGETVLPS